MKIAVVRLSALGDITQSLILAWMIKSNHKNAKIHWYTDEIFAPLVELCPFVDKVVGLKIKEAKNNLSFKILKSQIKLLRSTHQEYDYIIDMQGLLKSAIIARLIGKNVYGFDRFSVREKLATFFYKKSFLVPYGENVIKRYISLYDNVFNQKSALKITENKQAFFRLSELDLSEYLENASKNIVFVMGASWKSKRYPPAKMANVANSVFCNALVIWGSDEEEQLANEFKEECPKAKILPKLDYEDLVTLLARADLVVGGDTGPCHIAWAMNTPTLFIFGSTPSHRNALAGRYAYLIDSGKKINPYHVDKNDFSITTISEKTITKAIYELLAR